MVRILGVLGQSDGCRHNQPAARLEHARDVAQQRFRLRRMFDHLRADDTIEVCVRNGGERSVNRGPDTVRLERRDRQLGAEGIRIKAMEIVPATTTPAVQHPQQRPVSAAVVEYLIALVERRTVDDATIAFGGERVVGDEARPHFAPVICAGLGVLPEPGVGECICAHDS